MSYNADGVDVCCAARLLEDGSTVAVGTGVPCATAMLAQRTGAPRLVIFRGRRHRPATADHCRSAWAIRAPSSRLAATSMADVMENVPARLVDYCFLGGAQIDPTAISTRR